jgi:predicted acyltransferase
MLPRREANGVEGRSRSQVSERCVAVPSSPSTPEPEPRALAEPESVTLSSSTTAAVATASASTRLMSLDALRGFDMFWIIGGDRLASSLLSHWDSPVAETFKSQLEHVAWEGFRFYDLIFPLFLFLVGCVAPYSLAKYRATPTAVYGRILRRTLLLVLLGCICNNLLQFPWETMRWAGVLQRIGLCYGAAALVAVHCGVRGQSVFTLALLIGYWALLSFVAAPGFSAGDFTPAGNLAGYIDRQILPGKIYPEYYGFGDNEGLLSTLPAIATALLGVLTGEWLRSTARPWTKVAGLIGAAAVCLVAGWAWSFSFPIIKNIWTSSFVLVAAGWSLVLLAVFYALIDVLQWRWWAWGFVIIGMNAITIFVVPRFIDFAKISKYFLGGVASLSGEAGPTLLIAGSLAAKWLFLWYLYRQKVFLRL